MPRCHANFTTTSAAVIDRRALLISTGVHKEVARALEVTEATWYRWKNQYGGMSADDAKRLKELEKENSRLKKLLDEAELDKSMLKELAEGNF